MTVEKRVAKLEGGMSSVFELLSDVGEALDKQNDLNGAFIHLFCLLGEVVFEEEDTEGELAEALKKLMEKAG